MKSPSDTRGFPEGKAEKLVLDAYRRYKKKTQTAHRTMNTDIPPSIKKIEPTQSSISTWNGAVTDKYRWSQSISEVTVEIPLSITLTSKKDLSVSISATALSIKVLGQLVVGGVFPERVNQYESTWTLENLSCLTLSLEKSSERWWKSVLIGDPEIDTTKVESKKRIEDYDEATQGSIRKIVFEENQKRQGLLTSDQMDLNEKLQAAWNVPGSPFAGQEFDPNLIKNCNQ